MRKLFRNVLLTIAALTMMAGSAWAAAPVGSWLDISAAGIFTWDDDVDAAPSGAYVFGSEWLAGQAGVLNVDLGAAIPTPGAAAVNRSDINYKPAIAIGINNTIKITMTNGAIKANGGTYFLWDNTSGFVCANMVDFIANSDGDYVSMTFQFVQTIGALSPSMAVGDVASLVRTAAAPIPANRPILVVRNATLGSGMTMQVTDARDATGNLQTAPLTASKTVVKSAAQLSAKVQNLIAAATYADGQATSVIDVEATPVSRSKFVVEAGKDTPTTTTSTAAVLLINAPVNNGIVVAAASFTLTLNGDQAAIVATTGVKFNGTNFVRTAGTSWTYTGASAAPLLVPGTNDILITVNGTSVINTANYTVTLVVDPAEVGVANVTSLSAVSAFDWTVNAMQARIPYLIVDLTAGSTYVSFLEITNRSTQSAQVSVDAIVSNSDATVNTTETASNVITVPAGSITIVRMADIDSWFTSIDATKLYRVSLTLTVVAPQNNVDVSAFQLQTGAGRTMLPVLYNTNNALDGRKWQ